MKCTASGVYVSLRYSPDDQGATTAILSDVSLFGASMGVRLSLCHLAYHTHTRLCEGAGILVAPFRPAAALGFARVALAGMRMLRGVSLILVRSSMFEHRQRLWETALCLLLRLVLLVPCFRSGRLVKVRPDDAVSFLRSREHVELSEEATKILVPVCQRLCGRLLTFSELVRYHSQASGPANPYAVRAAADALSMLGRLEMLPAIQRTPNSVIRCSRCGSTEMLHRTDSCAVCGQACVRCACCNSLGLMTACSWLFHVPVERNLNDVSAKLPEVFLRIPFRLTHAQQRASGRVRRFIETSDSKQFLVWAACGAGKTEVACAAIALTLRQGGVVLYVAPRQSLASELHERLSGFFPSVEVALRTGQRQLGSIDARLTVCTAHQTLRFKHYADLVVFDETDAYPCEPGGYLERAVQRSVRHRGKIVCLTATPDSAMFERLQDGSLPFALIPERHHGKPVPVPQVVSSSGSLHRGMDGLPGNPGERWARKCLLEALHTDSPCRGLGRAQCPLSRTREAAARLLSRQEICLLCVAAADPSRTLVFVPTIALVELYRSALEGVLSHCWQDTRWGFCHSRLPDNESEVRKLRNRELDCIVTTTVLERGITIPGVNVIVARADSPVFGSRTLVQMAGRAGRTSDCPTGRVLFCVRRVTTEVKRAVSMIRFMNESARK